ncbi:hypothetical protein KUK_1315 [Taylorella equigenitalis 14/56]|uniref:Immunity protein 26 n=3 Tax=Taylorella equigenitalis TaxID=29575 RepID=A0A654KJ49_TAYEM|nr:immunity 26/phosphotriesterase HocA family protein [Taylorella equigenitalis]ADU92508.1 hypothetical protein TEQUI_1596 [Taylorella equigenitalis MCE9]AFN36056.1 hypothetical protein KUI_0984 [Taylorella equigenitalis ATCC 35865]ASY37993.1 hypothetical protein CA605_04720 [Taylorella equigenitalis]ASY39470.1 hypothetical protein CA604_04950 [Taylorella equigenitalis]ASY40981.1 hypothetical protein CAV20_04735 [Taylorella equigenitalis]
MIEKKRQRRKPGDFFAVPLEDGEYAFGRVLKNAMAFYDIKSNEILSIDELYKTKIIFKVWVMDNVITSGRYPIIGHIPLTEEELKPLVFAKRDVISGRHYLYIEGGTEIPCSRDDLIGLEVAAVWSDVHIEDRLNCYFRGEESKYQTTLTNRVLKD